MCLSPELKHNRADMGVSREREGTHSSTVIVLRLVVVQSVGVVFVVVSHNVAATAADCVCRGCVLILPE